MYNSVAPGGVQETRKGKAIAAAFLILSGLTRHPICPSRSTILHCDRIRRPLFLADPAAALASVSRMAIHTFIASLGQGGTLSANTISFSTSDTSRTGRVI